MSLLNEQKQELAETNQQLPVMTYDQYMQGQSLLKKFLKEIKIKRQGTRVITSYIWEFPDELIAKNFAYSMKDQFEQQLGGGEEGNG